MNNPALANRPAPEIPLPPKIDHPQVRKAATGYRDLVDRERAARQDAVEAEYAVDRAKEQDKRARADAIKASKTAPPAKATAKAEQELAAKRDHAEAHTLATADAATELTETIEKHRPAWTEKLDSDVTDAATACIDALANLEKAISNHAELAATRRWLTGFPTARYNPTIGGTVPDLRALSGEPYHLAAVLAGLRSRLEPKPETTAAAPTPLRQVG